MGERIKKVFSSRIFISVSGGILAYFIVGIINSFAEKINLWEILDLSKGEVIRSFNRKYKRVRHEMSPEEEDYIRKYNAPRKKYEEDIGRLHLYKGLLWVETSTKDEKRGIMIDVFNSKGQFLDNFYLALDGHLMSVQDNFIFVVKTDEEGNYIIKKCIIKDEN